MIQPNLARPSRRAAVGVSSVSSTPGRLHSSSKAFAAAGRSVEKLEVTAEQLRTGKAPILFIHGGNESDHVKDAVAAVREVVGSGDLRIVEGADHMTTLTRPEFGSAILEFLRSGKSE